MSESFQIQKRLLLTAARPVGVRVRTQTGETRDSKVSPPTLAVSVFLLVPFFVEGGVGESVVRDPPPQGTMKEGECQWTEWVKSPSGLGVARLASSLT